MNLISQTYSHLIKLIFLYYKKLISPLFGERCRFYPSCSDYCQEALIKKGLFFGSFLSIKRLLRCHPLHSGGFDPLDGTREISVRQEKNFNNFEVH
ncbi:MAG TPA: membrane protein insertion efficiency factor YidD [Oligoflexia bacterium]|nr:membrane protein insertion efficiency factor YidD [Oligoflexia bacterium]HMP26784.1 membrane protein insertion efficiency factor YidD [Oligoflexia bacterium]